MFNEDIDTFFDTAEFAETAALDGNDVAGVFSEEPVEVEFVQTIKTTFTCATIDSSGAGYGSTLVRADGSVYRVRHLRSDPSGRINKLILERQ